MTTPLPLPLPGEASPLPLPGQATPLPLPDTTVAAAPGGAPMQVIHQARRDADAARSRALLALDRGELTLADLLIQAGTPAGRALLRLRLDAVLTASGLSSAATFRILRHLTEVASPQGTPRHRTVAWLLDARCRGTRILALQDALARKNAPPWPGFPWGPLPESFPDVALTVAATGQITIRGEVA